MQLTELQQSPWLIADIGATNSRCAIFTPGEDSATGVEVFRNRNFTSLQDLLEQFVSALPSRPRHAALALAAPIVGNNVQMINCDWQFERDHLAGELGLAKLELLNDFHAVAYALANIPDENLMEIGRTSKRVDGNRAVLGPGSGLGMAAWIGDASSGKAMTGEGGHISIAARNEREESIVRHFRERFGHCSAERILSGPGIIELHLAMHGTTVESSEMITGNPQDANCRETMEQFFKFLGSVAADLALICGSFGGLYIAGGIVPACLEQVRQSGFRERFDDKNRYRDYMRSIPTYVVTDPTPGLTGLIAYINAAEGRTG